MIYNTISTKEVISKVLRDLNYQEEDFRVSDITEWIGEGLKKIGAIKALDIKITGKEDVPLLILSNYQCKLPRNMHHLLGVAYSVSPTGTFVPLRYGTGTYNYRNSENVNSSSELTSLAGDNAEIFLAMTIYGITYSEAVELLNNDSIKKELMSTLLAENKSASLIKQTNTTSDYTYVINNSYIKTNIKEGYLMIAYTTVPVDEEGYPLIPDSEMYKEALYWYVVTKLLYSKWLLGTVRDRQYESAKHSWNFYRKAAYAEAMMMNADQLESMKNQYLKLYPEIDEFSNFFDTLGEKQRIYSHNYFDRYTGKYR